MTALAIIACLVGLALMSFGYLFVFSEFSRSPPADETRDMTRKQIKRYRHLSAQNQIPRLIREGHKGALMMLAGLGVYAAVLVGIMVRG